MVENENQLTPDKWDAIIIGSGIGGLSAAAALSRTGHKVLLLEQYESLGGLTHSFSRNGFSWDVGIHYLSHVAPGEPLRVILDWLCDTPIEFASMGAIYDVLHIGDSEPLLVSRPYEAHALDLKERFPKERETIDAWFNAVHQGQEAAMSVTRLRAMPQPLGAFLEWWKGGKIERWCGRTTAEVADEITDNPDLKAAFLAQWPDHGGRPSRASFAMHSMISYSYLECGAWYPVGGSSVIAKHMLPVVTQGGGEARAGVTVEALVLEGERVVGVRTAEGDDMYADVVISSIGAHETVSQLLPNGHDKQDWVDEIRSLPCGICHFSLYLGFEGDVEAAGATKSNHWFYLSNETDVVWEDAPQSTPPSMFVSFASLKDPDHEPGPKQQHSGEIAVWADWSTVEQWADLSSAERGAAYAEFKRQAEERIFNQFASHFPELSKLVVFRELATPLSTVSITGHRQGAFYGLDVTPDRMLSDALRMKTPIKGLYLAGQDAATPGIPGALWGGVLCAGAVDPRVFKHIR